MKSWLFARRKPIALLAMITFLFASLNLSNIVVVQAEEQTETFMTISIDEAAVPSGTREYRKTGCNKADAVITRDKNETLFFGSSSLGSKKWTVGGYWQIQCSTLGYKEVSFTLKARSSGTGPKNFKVQYSIDNNTYIEINDSNYSITSTSLSAIGKDINLPAEACDQSNLYLRLVVNDNVNLNNGEIASGGSSNIQDITFKGISLGGQQTPTAGSVSADIQSSKPSGSTLDIADQLELSVTNAIFQPTTVVPGGSVTGSAVTVTGSTVNTNNSPQNLTEGSYTLNYQVNDQPAVAYTGPIKVSDIATPGQSFTIKAFITYQNILSSSVDFTYTVAMGCSDISKVRTGKNKTTYMIHGIVTFTDGVNVYVQDATGAINVCCKKDSETYKNVKVGNTVTAIGTKGNFKGLEQLGNADLTIDDSSISSVAVTKIEDITKFITNYNEYECQLVELDHLLVKNVAANGNTYLYDAQGHKLLFYKAGTSVFGTVKAGDVVNLTAVVSDYNGLQLRAGTLAKVTPVLDQFDKLSDVASMNENSNVVIHGTVNYLADQHIYLEDESGTIRLHCDESLAGLSIGNYIVAKGQVTTENSINEVSIALSDCSVFKTNDYTQTKATIAELVESPSKFEGRYISLEHAVIGDKKDGNVEVTQDNAKVLVSGIPEDSQFIKGTKVKFTAFVLKDTNGILLKIVDSSEIEVEEAKIPSQPIYDPISEDMFTSGMITLKEAIEFKNDKFVCQDKEIITIGQVVTKYGSNGVLDSIILEDVVDNEIVALQIYDKSNLNKYNIGDIVKITGKLSSYNGVPQVQSPTLEVLKSNVETIKPQVLTIAELLEGKDQYLSEYVLIKNVTLGSYDVKNTKVTDSTGEAQLYKGPAYDVVAEGTVIDLYAVWSKFSTSYQLRAGLSECYNIPGKVEIDTSITLPLASFSGTSSLGYTSPVIYGDLTSADDQLDQDAVLTLSTGAVPQISTSNNDVTNYCIGSTGLTEGQYYQLEIPAKGYGSIDLSFTMRGSNTGAKYFNVLCSSDGINYVKCDQISYTISNTNYTTGVTTTQEYVGKDTLEVSNNNVDYHVELPDLLNDCDKVYLRIQVANNEPIKGDTIGKAGVNRFFNIVLTASPVISDKACQIVRVTPQEGQIALNSELTMKTGTAGATIYYNINGGEYQIYDENAKPVITELPATVSVYAKKDQLADSIVVTYGYTQAKVASVKASPNGGAVKQNALVTLTCRTTEAKIVYSLDDGNTWNDYTGAIKLTTLPMSIQAKATLTGYIDSEISNIEFTKRLNDEYNIYFGQIHSHTEYSDGAGTCRQAYEYASTQAENIDFLAVTDHSNSFDNDTSATIKDGSVSSEWLEGHQLAEEYTNVEDEINPFVGIYGYEMTWSGGAPGHMNTYNTDGFLSRNMEGFKNGSTQSLPNYYEQLKTVPDSISMFNHPGTSFGDFYDFGFYDEEIDRLITLIEVGNGEGAIGSSGYFPSYEYYTRALDKGWHVSPANNQDNHKGNWGDANTGRTVILADSLSRDNIYDALRNMRTYATEDDDLKIWYTLNGADMGTIFEEAPDTVQIEVKVEDPTDDKVGKIEVIVNGGLTVAAQNMGSNQGTINFTLDPSYSYYYIRVTQPDGDLAVTAPVWISDVEAVGISSIKTDASLTVSGEPINIDTTIYNNENVDFNIDSIVYTVNGQVIHTTDVSTTGLSVIGSKKEGKDSFSYTHSGLGKTEIKVTVIGTLNGVEKQYNSVLQLDYVSPNMVTRVLVDGTHNNDYVTGYYGGNVGNFADLASKDYVKVEVVTDKFTKEMLDDCSLLIISAPAKKDGTYNSQAYGVSSFEDEFIALVKDYVDAGGNIILCGLADYQDSKDGQSSTQMNHLLGAIGATMRLNSDELVDDEKNGGSNYRLYFDQFNMNSPYLKGITPDQVYSAYSGCSILLNPENVEQGLSEALVMGHSSTYSIDSKNLDQNYVECPKGSLVALGHETLSSGSNVILAGTVFLSNFEVKTDLDNAGDSYYANRNILLNIIAQIRKELPTSTIAQMRQGEVGQVFAIDGWVTAGTAVEGNKFFDTIYVQDETAGTTVFPVADAGIKLGTKLHIVGYVDGYQGDKEIQVIEYKILDDQNLNVIEPKSVSTKDAADYDLYGGSLLKVTGKVTRVVTNSKGVDYFFLQDESGVEARVFIDGYILASDGLDTINDDVKVGNLVSAIGLSYFNPDGACLRVRDRAEVVLVSTQPSVTPTSPSETEAKEDQTVQEQKNLQKIKEAIQDSIKQNKAKEVNLDLSKTGELPSSILNAISGNKVILVINLGNGISCKINGAFVKAGIDKNINLSVKKDVHSVPQDKLNKILTEQSSKSKAQQISLKHEGPFGFDVAFTFDLSSLTKDMEDHKVAILYYYDKVADKLVLQSVSKLNKNNQATFNYNHASDYVIVVSDDFKFDASILNQITFADGKNALALCSNGTTMKNHQLKILYPEEIEQSIEYGSLSNKVKYETTNQSVAVVSKTGKISAKGEGTAVIRATITIEDQTIVLERKVEVKKASLKLTLSAKKIKVGEKITAVCELYGYKKEDLVWSTSQPKKATVGKNAGKKHVTVTGKTAGKDTVIVKVKGVKGKSIKKQCKVEITK